MTLENSQSEIFVLENFALYDTDTTGYGLDIAENINPTEPQLNSIQSENDLVIEEITPIQSDKSDFDQIVFIRLVVK